MHITCCLYKRNLSFKSMLSHFLSFVMITCFWTWIVLLFMMGDTFNFENLEEELKILSHEAEWYEENLKKNHAFYVLDQHFYLLTDCDKTGNLQDGNYVLVEFAGVEKIFSWSAISAMRTKIILKQFFLEICRDLKFIFFSSSSISIFIFLKIFLKRIKNRFTYILKVMEEV